MKCAVCQDREVSGGKTTGAAKKLDLCLQCWSVQKIRRDRAEVLGVTLRKAPQGRGRKAAPARTPDRDVPRYTCFEDLVRVIVRDELRRLLETVIDGK